jgi:transcription factor SPT20
MNGGSKDASHQLTASQLQQLTPNQIQQLKQQQLLKQQRAAARARARNYHFATTTEEILRKFSKFPASLTLHIYENHFKFNNSQDSNIIPRDSPMIKSFMNYVLKEQIPPEMSELLKDFSIKSYDGCLILQVYDHRNMVPTGTVNQGKNQQLKAEQMSKTTSEKSSDKTSTTTTSDSSSSTSTPSVITKPKTYRSLLRPTQLSLYYDLLYHTDSALTKFTDLLSLQMEAEILTLTKRKLDLSVPLNPYLCDDYLKPLSDFPQKVWDEKSQDYKIVFSHREGVTNPPRKLHQDELVLHKSSDYEEIMLLLSNKSKKTENDLEKKLVIVGPMSLPTSTTLSSTKPSSKESTVGPDAKNKKTDKVLSIPQPSTVKPVQATTRATGQFMRLRLIEEIRKKRETEKAQQEAKIQAQTTAATQNTLINGTLANGSGGGINQPTPAPAPQMNQFATQGTQAQQLQEQQFKRQKLAQNPNMLPQNSTANQIQPQSYKSVSTAPQIPNMAQQAPGTLANPQMNQQKAAMSVQQQQQRLRLQQQQQAQQAQQAQQTQQAQPGQQQARPQRTLQQQQQQQIFQSTLSPEEQQLFRQMQQKMNAFAVMGNTGQAPNGQQLNPQQKQQALQQYKAIQQQLVQKFPVYFQRLKQFQILQQQRRQQQQQQVPQNQ